MLSLNDNGNETPIRNELSSLFISSLLQIFLHEWLPLSVQATILQSLMRSLMGTNAGNVKRAPQGRDCQLTAETSLHLKLPLNACLVYSVKLIRVDKLVLARLATLVMSTEKPSKLVH